MRLAGSILVCLVAIASAAGADAVTSPLDVYAIGATGRTSQVRASFEVPSDPAARDLRDDAVVVGIGTETPTLFSAASSRLKFNRTGTRLRYVAPKHSQARILKMRLSTAAGSLDLTLGGAKVDVRKPPVIALSLAGRTYRWVPPVPSGQPDPGPLPDAPASWGFPDGPLAFTSVYRARVQVLGTTAQNRAIHNAAELWNFTSSVALPVSVQAQLSQTDFSHDMLVAAAGDVVGLGAIPFSVRVRSVTVTSGRLAVGYDKYWGNLFYEPPGTPVFSAGFDIARVPVSGAVPADFYATPVKTQLPYQ
jgi:hypothetical protein